MTTNPLNIIFVPVEIKIPTQIIMASIEECISAAIDGLGQDALGAEIAYKNVISGTYPLASLALMTAQIAQHAENSTAAIEELLRQPLGH